MHLVTTAALPWMTGTAVNPLLRAAYLHDRLQQINSENNYNSTKVITSWVTLVIPWLELEEDQQRLYGRIFDSPQEQEEFVRDWLRNQAHMPDAAQNLNIVFYNARYHAGLGSVFAMGDIIQDLPPDELDVCILEEPEVSGNVSSLR
jgi:digalactosyldiacylglycerol synthase